jgi:hypothetical protein
MENLKIHFWDSLTSHPERESFRQDLSSKGIKTSIDIADVTGVNLLFIHGADSASFNNHIFQSHILKVSFGDNFTKMYPIFKEENRISYIEASELISRFEKIYDELQTISELTIENLYTVIFKHHPTLERLAQPFIFGSNIEQEKIDAYNTEFNKLYGNNA